MANETVQVIKGNLTADPELKTTPSGASVVNFTIASTPRLYNRETNEWNDGDTLFMRCTAWRDLAENIAESLTKGSTVIAEGFLGQRSYETREGEHRTVVELTVQDIGASLKNATVEISKVRRDSGSANAKPKAAQRAAEEDAEEAEDERPAPRTKAPARRQPARRQAAEPDEADDF